MPSLFVRSFASVPSFAITVTGTPFTAFPSLSVIPIIILLSGVIPFSSGSLTVTLPLSLSTLTIAPFTAPSLSFTDTLYE